VTDADTHIHPAAIKLLVRRIGRSRRIAAVAGAPHVTNRQNVLCAMQILEAASIIGLIRRTQSLMGTVGVVAGVLGLFRRDRVLEVGGYEPRLSTEDIDLSWRLLLAGWHTAYEPDALVGMQVPTTIRALSAQRRRWARGQGEVLNLHLRAVGALAGAPSYRSCRCPSPGASGSRQWPSCSWLSRCSWTSATTGSPRSRFCSRPCWRWPIG